MSKSSLPASTSVRTISSTADAHTTNTVRKSRWNPRPHHDDPNVKTYDFAYLTGIAPPTLTARIIASIQTILIGLLSEPLLLRTLLLIFGGCCSNVYTLESILTLSSSTGTLITLLQFVFITLYTLPSQLTFSVVSPSDPPPLQPTQSVWLPRIKGRKVPLRQWCIFASQFVLINVLNNAAFEYKISLPLHIILRSAGPVASMCVGYVWKGRSYSKRKVISVALLFVGVVLAALSDAGAKEPSSPSGSKREGGRQGSVNATNTYSETFKENESSALAQQAPGFALLTLALILSSVMGVWSDTLYAQYGRTPAMASEQLFYGHLLSLPFFILQYKTLHQQYATLMAASTASSTNSSQLLAEDLSVSPTTNLLQQLDNPPPSTSRLGLLPLLFEQIPRAVLLLLLNSITQIACISGVHHLSTQTSSLTVSIVLNVRKVVSLLLSIWLFGNQLPLGVLLGAAIVFAGGALYGIPDKKGPNMKKVEEVERRRLASGVEVTDRERESKKDR